MTLCGASVADGWRIAPQIDATVTATNNAGYADGFERRSDTVFDIAPSVRLLGRGAAYTLEGQFELHGIAYARDTEPSHLLPSGRLALASVPVARWLYFDAVAEVEQTAEDPFAPQPDVQSSANRLTTSRLLLSPYLRHDFSDIDSLLVRSDTERIWRSGGASSADTASGIVGEIDDSTTESALLRLARRAVPVGGALELAQLDTHYHGDSVLRTRSARGIVAFAPNPQVEFGLVGGVENSRFTDSDETDPVYGVRMQLAPTERSNIVASVEHRFFGTGWDLQASNRSPFTALSIRFFRQPTAQTSSAVLDPLVTPSGLLDATLTTRNPDPVARAALVDELVAKLGLPTQLGRPVEVFSDAAQLERALDISAAFIGRLSVVTFGAYTRRFDALQRNGETLPTLGGYAQANRQAGVSIDLNRRISPRSSVDLLVDWSRIDGLGTAASDTSHEWEVRASLVHELSPRSTLTVGVRRQSFDSTIGNIRSGWEAAAFVGLGHRF